MRRASRASTRFEERLCTYRGEWLHEGGSFLPPTSSVHVLTVSSS